MKKCTIFLNPNKWFFHFFAMNLLIDYSFKGSEGLNQIRENLTRVFSQSPRKGWNICILTDKDKNVPGKKYSNVKYISTNFKVNTWFNKWIWTNFIFPKFLVQNDIDVFYSFHSNVTKRIKNVAGIVITINNMLPFTKERMAKPHFFSFSKLRNVLLKHYYIKGMRIADAVVLHSYHSFTVLEEYSPALKEKVYIALTGVPFDIKFNLNGMAPHPNNGEKFFFYFSSIFPYKNHLNLLYSYKDALKERDLPDLLFAGIPGEKKYLQKILKRINELKIENKVRYLGIIDRNLIPSLIYYAEANFFPSTCETNPVILTEIMENKGVIACSNLPPMPEIVKDAGFYFDPLSVQSIKETIITIIDNPSKTLEMKTLAYQRAKELDWKDCENKIWEAVIASKNCFNYRKKEVI